MFSTLSKISPLNVAHKSFILNKIFFITFFLSLFILLITFLNPRSIFQQHKQDIDKWERCERPKPYQPIIFKWHIQSSNKKKLGGGKNLWTFAGHGQMGEKMEETGGLWTEMNGVL